MSTTRDFHSLVFIMHIQKRKNVVEYNYRVDREWVINVLQTSENYFTP